MIRDARKWICGAETRGLITAVIGLVVSVNFVGCATPAPKQKMAVDSGRQVRKLKSQLRKQKSVIQDLKERNLVLEKRGQIDSLSAPEISDAEKPAVLPGSFDAKELADAEAYAGGESIGGPVKLPSKLPGKIAVKAPTRAPSLVDSIASTNPLESNAKSQVSAKPAAPLAAAAAPQTPVSVASVKTGEHFLYSKILETYRSHNEDELQKTLQLLLKTYPESVFADNAVYLSGLQAFENGNLKVAKRQFEKLLKEYPRSNKAVSALFAKAAIEKRSGNVANAKRSFLRIRDQYPGSPEAARVSVELKLLESAKSKIRES